MKKICATMGAGERKKGACGMVYLAITAAIFTLDFFLKKYIDKTMRIPMIDGIRCLNLSNAVSILEYEVLRHTNFEHLKETSERLLED